MQSAEQREPQWPLVGGEYKAKKPGIGMCRVTRIEGKRVFSLFLNVAWKAMSDEEEEDRLSDFREFYDSHNYAQPSREAQMEALLRDMLADEAFADLLQGIGDEPRWYKDARSLLSTKGGAL